MSVLVRRPPSNVTTISARDLLLICDVFVSLHFLPLITASSIIREHGSCLEIPFIFPSVALEILAKMVTETVQGAGVRWESLE